MLEKWKCAVDRGKKFGAFLTDLSKAFDCHDDELLIAKLKAHGFSLLALKLVHNDLWQRNNRKPIGTKVNNTNFSWLEIIFGAAQGSIFRPLLFTILAHLFFVSNDVDIVSDGDGNSPYVAACYIIGVITSIQGLIWVV